MLTTLPRTLSAPWPTVTPAVATRTETRTTDGPPAVELRDEPRRRVLCIDDDEEARFLLSAYFSLVAGIDLIVAGTLEDGARLLTAPAPHVVLLDTEIAGHSTERFVSSIVGARNPPVVIVSADVRETTVHRFRDCGVRAYQPKPVDLRQLSGVIQNLACSVGPK